MVSTVTSLRALGPVKQVDIVESCLKGLPDLHGDRYLVFVAYGIHGRHQRSLIKLTGEGQQGFIAGPRVPGL